jgi:hypothetical protein
VGTELNVWLQVLIGFLALLLIGDVFVRAFYGLQYYRHFPLFKPIQYARESNLTETSGN